MFACFARAFTLNTVSVFFCCCFVILCACPCSSSLIAPFVLWTTCSLFSRLCTCCFVLRFDFGSRCSRRTCFRLLVVCILCACSLARLIICAGFGFCFSLFAFVSDLVILCYIFTHTCTILCGSIYICAHTCARFCALICVCTHTRTILCADIAAVFCVCCRPTPGFHGLQAGFPERIAGGTAVRGHP